MGIEFKPANFKFNMAALYWSAPQKFMLNFLFRMLCAARFDKEACFEHDAMKVFMTKTKILVPNIKFGRSDLHISLHLRSITFSYSFYYNSFIFFYLFAPIISSNNKYTYL